MGSKYTGSGSAARGGAGRSGGAGQCHVATMFGYLAGAGGGGGGAAAAQRGERDLGEILGPAARA